MSSIDRRRFMAGALGASAGLALGSLSTSLRAAPPDCNEDVYSDLGSGELSRSINAIPGDSTEYQILEIFLYGGLSPWETFVLLDDPCSVTENWCSWWGELPYLDNLQWRCPGAPDFLTTALETGWRDAQNRLVMFGPATTPLFRSTLEGNPQGPRLIDNMRVVVLRHNLLPHEAAIPYAQCGLRLGNPRRAGIGAAIAHRALTRQGGGSSPASFVLFPSGRVTAADNVSASLSLGRHPAGARPLELQIGGNDQFYAQLDRSGLLGGQLPSRNSMLRSFRNRYRKSMTRALSPSRSAGYGAYESAMMRLLQAEQIQAQIDADYLTTLGDVTHCTRGNLSRSNHTGLQLSQAAGLLKNPSTRYVGVIDGGLKPIGGAGYDTHENNAAITQGNLFYTLNELHKLVAADDICLDRTMIVLNTEFGRTPNRGNSPDGRDHWPEGYAVAVLGGPVQPGFSGAINDAGLALQALNGAFTPTDFLGGVLLAAGLNPVNPNLIFSEADFSFSITNGSGGNADKIQRNLAKHILGIVEQQG